MNFTTKALAAAVALAASATASAAQLQPASTGNGSFALYVWNQTTQTSYIRNLDNALTELGFFSDFEPTDTKAQGGFSIAADDTLTNFLASIATQGSTVFEDTRWGIIGGESSGVSNMAITLSGTLNAATNNTAINNALGTTNSLGNNTTSISRLSNADSYTTSASEFGSAFSANSGRAAGSAFRASFSATKIGELATMYLYTGAAGVATGTRVAYSFPFRLETDGTLNYVPVPAAVWLLGSALAGVAGVARRRTA